MCKQEESQTASSGDQTLKIDKLSAMSRDEALKYMKEQAPNLVALFGVSSAIRSFGNLEIGDDISPVMQAVLAAVPKKELFKFVTRNRELEPGEWAI